jgi:hypothetical protein
LPGDHDSVSDALLQWVRQNGGQVGYLLWLQNTTDTNCQALLQGNWFPVTNARSQAPSSVDSAAAAGWHWNCCHAGLAVAWRCNTRSH